MILREQVSFAFERKKKLFFAATLSGTQRSNLRHCSAPSVSFITLNDVTSYIVKKKVSSKRYSTALYGTSFLDHSVLLRRFTALVLSRKRSEPYKREKKKKMRWRATTQAIDSYGNAFRRCTQSLQMFFFYDTYIECLYATIYVRAAPYVLSPNVLN